MLEMVAAMTEWTDDELALLQGVLERMYDAATSLRRYPDAPKQNREYQQKKLAACTRLASALVHA
jgi:hypothetical protein